MGFLSSKIKQQEEASMAIPLDPKQIVSFEELLMSYLRRIFYANFTHLGKKK